MLGLPQRRPNDGLKEHRRLMERTQNTRHLTYLNLVIMTKSFGSSLYSLVPWSHIVASFFICKSVFYFSFRSKNRIKMLLNLRLFELKIILATGKERYCVWKSTSTPAPRDQELQEKMFETLGVPFGMNGFPDIS